MLKIVGILMVVLGATSTGFGLSAYVRRSVQTLQQLIATLEQMKSEFLFRKTPLPELVRILSVSSNGDVAAFWGVVADALYQRRESSVYEIMRRALSSRQAAGFSVPVRRILLNLGAGLGHYDTAGQVRAVDLALSRLGGQLTELQAEQKARVRSYCTLGICAGLALAILMF